MRLSKGLSYPQCPWSSPHRQVPSDRVTAALRKGFGPHVLIAQASAQAPYLKSVSSGSVARTSVADFESVARPHPTTLRGE